MDADASTDPKFEIGHVLFIDSVGYSTLLIGEQSEVVRELKEVVATSEQVRAAQNEGKLVSLPTGDGVVLVFRNGAEAPVRCALEIARAIKKYPQLRLRMGIHSGPVNVVNDVTNRARSPSLTLVAAIALPLFHCCFCVAAPVGSERSTNSDFLFEL